MAAIRSRGTKPEVRLQNLVEEMLPRTRVVLHPDLPGRPDLFVPGLGLAVFMDGCFWHACPKHGRIPQDNIAYWGPKLERTRIRDRAAVTVLRRSFTTVRIWEHELKGSGSSARRKLRRALVRTANRAITRRTD